MAKPPMDYQTITTTNRVEMRMKKSDRRVGALVLVLVALGSLLLVVLPFCCISQVNDILFMGSIVSLLYSLAIFISYQSFLPLRRHPNPLIYQKSIIDLILAINYICQFVLASQHIFIPQWVPLLTQGLLLTGESWFFAMSMDLVSSIANPFSSFPDNLKLYKIGSFCVGLTVAGSLAIRLHTDAARQQHYGEVYFWFHHIEFYGFGFDVWMFYYSWIIFFMIFAVWSLIFVHRRLQEGLDQTFEARKRVLSNGRIATITYVIWSTLLVFMCIFNTTTPRTYIDAEDVWAFVHSCRGLVNIIVWVLINRKEMLRLYVNHGSLDERFCKADDIDEFLKPQLNKALRVQVIDLATLGIIKAVQHYEDSRNNISIQRESNQSFMYNWSAKTCSDSSRNTLFTPLKSDDNLMSLDYGNSGDIISSKVQSPEKLDDNQLQNGVFSNYQPELFALIRSFFNIQSNEYMRAFEETANERLSEGKSGAFVFNTVNKKYLVKSMTVEEKDFLLSILPRYYNYIKWNKATLLPKFFGIHEMKMYGQLFSFVVMANIFDTEQIIHRRYDIKGSWIDRNAPACVSGKKYLCANCNELFEFGSEDDYCPSVVKEHYPNIALRDNDLKKRMRLPPDVSASVLMQLNRDSEFLCGMGITDYSLLIGMHYSEFSIKQDKFINQMNKSPTCSTNNSDSEDDEEFSISSPTINQKYKRIDSCSQLKKLANKKDIEEPKCNRNNHQHNAETVSGPSTYFLGIIDILQTWTLKKKAERLYKVVVLRRDGKGISAMPPKPYMKRFQKKVAQILRTHVRQSNQRSG